MSEASRAALLFLFHSQYRGVARRDYINKEMMIISKNIQIPMSVAADIYRLIYSLADYELDCDTNVIIKRLENALNAKVEAMEKRRAYTEYKTASDDESKEAARRKYLNLAGVHPDWRWGAEAVKERQET